MELAASGAGSFITLAETQGLVCEEGDGAVVRRVVCVVVHLSVLILRSHESLFFLWCADWFQAGEWNSCHSQTPFFSVWSSGTCVLSDLWAQNLRERLNLKGSCVFFCFFLSALTRTAVMVTGSKTCKLQVITPFFGSHLSADVKKKKKRKEKKRKKEKWVSCS